MTFDVDKDIIDRDIDSSGGSDESKVFRIYKDLVNEKSVSRSTSKDWKPATSPKKIEDYANERESIKNEGLRKDIKMKVMTLKVLFGFLAFETIIIFAFAFFQAVEGPFGFSLEEWSFKLMITATISQITVMLVIAVKHLFPNK